MSAPRTLALSSGVTTMRTTLTLVAALLSASVAAAAPVSLTGLDPQAYMQRRNRAPDVSSELAALPIDDVLRVLSDDSAVLWSKDDAYPAGLKAEERQARRQRERLAVKQGALVVLAKSADARAEGAIVAALDDVDDAVAASAAERLGQKRGARALEVLTATVNSERRSLGVRAGACAGLARLRTSEAQVVLLDIVSGQAPDALKGHAIEAIETLGSRWAFEAIKQVAVGETLRAQAAQTLSAIALDGDVAVRRDRAVKRLSAN